MTQSATVDEQETGPEPESAPAATPAARHSWVRRGATALRPVLFAGLVGGAVLLFTVPDYNPASALFEYLIRVTVAGFVLLGAAAWWLSTRRGRTWGMDLAPALVGGVAAVTIAGSLNGTPFAPGGLSGDQTFRTAAITRFADSWHNADFTFAGLPSFYAPAYFWVMGRAADLAAVEAWRMTKVGTVLTALLVPVVTYLLWRRLVPIGTAALIAVVPLVVENYYEPYAWLVIFALVPWWLETVHGLRRPGKRPGHPLLLGAIGALLFLTYYYFFFVAAIGLLLWLGVERLTGELRRRQVGRAVLTLAIAAAASSFYWLPLLVSILRADHPESLANRWFSPSHPSFPLPMWEFSAVGAVALLGLAYLVWTVRRDPLSRGLVVLLAAAYTWYLIGAAAAVADTPLLTFRGKPLIPLLLLIAGVLALVRLTRAAADRFDPTDVRRVAWVGAVTLVIFVAQGFVGAVLNSPLNAAAHNAALPDGSLPSHASAEAEVPDPPAAAVRDAIDAGYAGAGNPVVLSDRNDILSVYPYFGFLQWNAHYAHPASEFQARAQWLETLAASPDPAAFAAAAADNPYDPIDAFVLRDDGDTLTMTYGADNFPAGLRRGEVSFDRDLFDPAYFDVADLGDTVVATRR